MSMSIEHLGFTGSRIIGSKAQQHALGEILMNIARYGPLWLHHGDCLGMDALAARIWKTYGGKTHGHPPSDPKQRAYVESDIEERPKDYLDRNKDIVAASSFLIGCPATTAEQMRGSGTWATIRYARKAEKPLLLIWPNGTVTRERWANSALRWY